MRDEEAEIAAVRARSYRLVETVFALFCLTFLAIGLVAHNDPGLFGLEADGPNTISAGSLFLGAAYCFLMFVWDRMAALDTARR